MIRCGACNRWTPGIEGACSVCYEGSLPACDVGTKEVITSVREEEHRLDMRVLLAKQRQEPKPE